MATTIKQPSMAEIIAVAMLTPALQLYGNPSFQTLLDGLYKKNKRTYKSAMNAFYSLVDVHLEELAQGSPTPIDDLFVSFLKTSVEQNALKNGVALNNQDED